MALIKIIVQLVVDAARFAVLQLRSTRSVEAENLFLRRQLGLFKERGMKPRRVDAATITHGLLGATGLDNRVVYVERGTAHRIGIKLAAEASENYLKAEMAKWKRLIGVSGAQID